MQIFQESWQAKAKAKVTNMESKIPKEWTLEKADLDEAKKQRNITGPFIERFLGDSEVDIIRNNSVQVSALYSCGGSSGILSYCSSCSANCQ